ncbi:CMD domain-containing protein [Yersinia hibernica]|uniref:CMD domain-containing protein n=1 Tax=Yersinia hibernica TaxID=2339259 RepID=A0ABX5QZU5_9GAMM|nr:CMD domain-containing protein [Yersinia hibernica]QAX78541.1 CMD domain-containing protein [Yersinia hibernica]
MVQFRRQDNAHWYHETQRSGRALATCGAGENNTGNSGDIDNTYQEGNIIEQGIFLLGLANNIPTVLDDTLHHHTAILSAADAMYQALFPPVVDLNRENTFSLYDRLSSALTVAQVTGIQRLCSHYAARLTPLSSPDASRESNIRLTQITQYARQLASQPTLIDRHALQQLADVGLTDSDIIVLSQIIGFVGFQARVVAGFSAQAGYPTVILPGFPRMEDAPSDPVSQSQPHWQGWLPSRQENKPVAGPDSPAQSEITLNQLLAHHQASFQAYRAITTRLSRPQHMPSDWLELVSLASARINGSRYCQAKHQHHWRQLTANTAFLAALQSGIDNALAIPPQNHMFHPLIQLTAELTRAPERFSQQHIAPLQALGLSDRQLLSIIFHVASAGWVNRLRHTLGRTV